LVVKAKSCINNFLGSNFEFSLRGLLSWVCRKDFVLFIFIVGFLSTLIIWLTERRIRLIDSEKVIKVEEVKEETKEEKKEEVLEANPLGNVLVVIPSAKETVVSQVIGGGTLITKSSPETPPIKNIQPLDGTMEIVIGQDGRVTGVNGQAVKINGVLLESAQIKYDLEHKPISLMIDVSSEKPQRGKNWGEDRDDEEVKKVSRRHRNYDYVDEETHEHVTIGRGDNLKLTDPVIDKFFQVKAQGRNQAVDYFDNDYIEPLKNDYGRKFVDFVTFKIGKKEYPKAVFNYVVHNAVPSKDEVDMLNYQYRHWIRDVTGNQVELEAIPIKPRKKSNENLIPPSEVPNMNGTNQLEWYKERTAELEKVNKEIVDKYKPKQIMTKKDTKSTMCLRGASCPFLAAGTCNYSHKKQPVADPNSKRQQKLRKREAQKSGVVQEAVMVNNLQVDPSSVESSIFRVTKLIGDSDKEIFSCCATIFSNRIFFWKHSLEQAVKVRISNKIFDSGLIDVSDLFEIDMSQFQAGDNLMFIPAPSNVKIPQLKVNSSEIKEGQQVWMSCYSEDEPIRQLVSSGNVTVISPLTNPTHLMYNFTTKFGDCSAGVYIAGTAKLCGLHLIGSAQGNMCLYLSKEVVMHLQKPYKRKNL